MRLMELGEMTVQVTENGFAFWADGFIAFDCPIERAKVDHRSAVKCLMLLQQMMLDSEQKSGLASALRESLIDFCLKARAELEGVPVGAIDVTVFAKMSDKALQREANWLDGLLDK